MNFRALFCLILVTLVGACSSEQGEPPEGLGGARGELTEKSCNQDADCDDGSFCNGVESCDDGLCRLGVPPDCDDGIDCTSDTCSHSTNGCVHRAADLDGDGHAAATCIGPSGEALGDDCDDADANRFPGNPEGCSAQEPTHDEDCDPSTFGYRDEDLDGEISAECCNEDGEGDAICGSDCDDDDYRKNSTYPEICDDIDNDCDGRVDVDTKEVLWYLDEDGDHFGMPSDDAILSCAPVEGYSLRSSDCDDSTGAVHSAAVEVCDGADNDCDGETDEDGVCACAPAGMQRPCACRTGGTGVQACEGGLWATCDCTECVEGTKDCLGELLPRTCLGGRWVVEPSCRGARPICLQGSCVCPDGTLNCQEVADVIAPVVLATTPTANALLESTTVGLLGVMFSEAVLLPPSGTPALSLHDGLGRPVVGTVAAGGNTILFELGEALQPGMTFTLTVSGEVGDLAGNVLGTDTVLDFATGTDITAVAVSSDETVRHSTPHFSISPGGEGLLLAEERSGYGLGSVVPVGVRAFHLQEGSWTAGEIVMPVGQLWGGAVDDRGQGVALQLATNAAMLSYNGADWTTIAPHQAVGTTRANVVLSNKLGRVLAVSSTSTDLRLDSRQPAGSWDTPAIFTPGDLANPFPLMVAGMNQAGRAVVLYKASGEAIGLVHSTTDLASWSTPTKVEIGGTNRISQFSAAVDSTGEAVVVYTQQTPLYGRYQFHEGKLSAGGVWTQGALLGSDEDLQEGLPVVVVDELNQFTVFGVAGNREVRAWRRESGVWSGETIVSVKGALSFSSLGAQANASGTVVAVWTQGSNEVWAARLDPGEDWYVQRVVESDGSTIFNPRVGVDDSGVAHIVFDRNGMYTLTF